MWFWVGEDLILPFRLEELVRRLEQLRELLQLDLLHGREGREDFPNLRPQRDLEPEQ